VITNRTAVPLRGAAALPYFLIKERNTNCIIPPLR
jgi:hypothetical protein